MKAARAILITIAVSLNSGCATQDEEIVTQSSQAEHLDLPEPLQRAFNDRFSNARISYWTRVTTPDGKMTYRIFYDDVLGGPEEVWMAPSGEILFPEHLRTTP